MIRRLGSCFALRETFNQWKGGFFEWVSIDPAQRPNSPIYHARPPSPLSIKINRIIQQQLFLSSSGQQQHKYSIHLLSPERKNENDFLIGQQHSHSIFIRRVSRVKPTVGLYTNELWKKLPPKNPWSQLNTTQRDQIIEKKSSPFVTEIFYTKKNGCKSHKIAMTDWKAESNKMSKTNKNQKPFQEQQ